MLIDFGVMALSFGAIFVVELPDKTFIAALVLATRYRPLLVWIGVGLAFLVQTGVAVGLGAVVTLLPADLVRWIAVAIFLLGAFLLFREGREADADADELASEVGETPATRTGLAAVGTSFLVLFAAEWGDLSQLLTISLVGKYEAPLSVFIGAWAALLLVSGIAVMAGKLLLDHLKLSLIHYAGAAICLLLATITIVELVG